MAINNGNVNWLLEVLGKPLQLTSKSTLHQVDKGQTHKVFRLTDGARCYAVKLFDGMNLAMSSRRQQAKLQSQLAAIGIAPIPVWFDEANGIWVENWVKTSDIEATHEENLAFAMTQIHSLSVDTHRLILSEEWAYYIATAKLGNDHHLVAQAHTLYEDAAAQATIDKPVLCHHDLSVDHIAHNEPLCIFDWEYAALGNRYFDMAAACHVNGLTAEQQQSLAVHYAHANAMDSDEVMTKLTFFLPAVTLTVQLWEAARTALLEST